MDTKTTTIELPRIDGESSRAYAARVEYVTMGAGRSLDKLRQKYVKNTSYIRQLQEWSAQYGWVSSAEKYDSEVALITVNEAASQYQADLKAFRTKYGKTGDDLHKVANAMLVVFSQQIQGKKIVDKEGKTHILPGIEMNAGTLGQIKAALQAAADLEALSLRVESLLNSQQQEETQ